MTKKIIVRNVKKLTFKRWKNTPWAIFGSIGKIVKIALLCFSYFLMSNFSVQAQIDTIGIDEISINSTRIPTLLNESARIIFIISKEEIKLMPIHSVQDLLENLSGIDVRQRGAEGVQADVGIRGGTFEQTLILINGFKINDVQTGHHNMNLPIDIENIDRIEILEGPGSRIFGINAYSGAINIITNSEKEKNIKLSGFAGQHNLFGLNASVSHFYKNWSNNLSVSKKKSNGYLENENINNTDFNIFNIFYQSKIKTKIANFFIQTGYTNKSFGANSFYTPAFPWQYEQTKTGFASFKTVKTGQNYRLILSFYGRRHKDRFELFREDKYKRNGKYFVAENSDTAKFYPNIFEAWNYYSGHNYHLTDIISSELKYDFTTKIGKTAIGTEFRNAQIFSNVLGEDLENPKSVGGEKYGEFTKSKKRYNINFYGEHIFYFNKFSVSGGISGNYNNDFLWNFSGGIDFAYNFTKKIKTFISGNQAVRLPSFTDLYYAGPTNTGNPNLKPEKSATYETGLKFTDKNLTAHASIFFRKGKNTIDWVKLNSEDKWQSQNITELNTSGFEINTKYNFDNNFFIKNFTISYSYTNITKQSNEYISNYVLDFLKHKANFSVNHKIYDKISATWQARYENREGSFSLFDLETKTYTGEENYKAFFLTDVKIFWQNKYIEIYTATSNIFDTNYRELGNIIMPGRQIKIGMKINLSL